MPLCRRRNRNIRNGRNCLTSKVKNSDQKLTFIIIMQKVFHRLKFARNAFLMLKRSFCLNHRFTPRLQKPPFSSMSTMISQANDEPWLLYQYIECTEKPWLYTKGGYHPLFIGDTLQERYVIIHKLGFGGFATIWLAYDKEKDKNVAIKVCTSSSPSREQDILETLSQEQFNKSTHLGSTMILKLNNKFVIHGPNGTHNCFVTSPGICSLSAAQGELRSYSFQIDVARSIASQLILVVAYVHSRGFVHGGKPTSLLDASYLIHR